MPGLVAILGGNSTGVDAAKEEAEQRAKYPLLFHPEEKVEMAFQVKGFVSSGKANTGSRSSFELLLESQNLKIPRPKLHCNFSSLLHVRDETNHSLLLIAFY